MNQCIEISDYDFYVLTCFCKCLVIVQLHCADTVPAWECCLGSECGTVEFGLDIVIPLCSFSWTAHL